MYVLPRLFGKRQNATGSPTKIECGKRSMYNEINIKYLDQTCERELNILV